MEKTSPSAQMFSGEEPLRHSSIDVKNLFSDTYANLIAPWENLYGEVGSSSAAEYESVRDPVDTTSPVIGTDRTDYDAGAEGQAVTADSFGDSGFESWDSVTTIDARVIEVTQNRVKLDCLVSRSKKVFEPRFFKRSLLEGEVDCAPGSYVLIRIFERPGKIVFAFSDGNRLINREPFEDTAQYDDLDTLGMDKPL